MSVGFLEPASSSIFHCIVLLNFIIHEKSLTLNHILFKLRHLKLSFFITLFHFRQVIEPSLSYPPGVGVTNVHEADLPASGWIKKEFDDV